MGSRDWPLWIELLTIIITVVLMSVLKYAVLPNFDELVATEVYEFMGAIAVASIVFFCLFICWDWRRERKKENAEEIPSDHAIEAPSCNYCTDGLRYIEYDDMSRFYDDPDDVAMHEIVGIADEACQIAHVALDPIFRIDEPRPPEALTNRLNALKQRVEDWKERIS